MSNISLNYAKIIDPASFKSINLAKIYIGEYGTLPNPAISGTWKQAYFVNSDGTRTAASQPIHTNAAGYAVDGSGNIKTIQVDGGYSLLVQDQYGATKFSQACSAANSGAVLEFDTIAGFTVALDGSVCYFKGRDTVGDGGGGPLRFLAGSTATANGVTVYAVPGGRLMREGWQAFGIDVRWAGASPSASAAVNSVAIQAALDVGGEIIFSGIYNFDIPLVVTKLNTRLLSPTRGTVGADHGLKYTGPLTTSPMITVQNGKHGFEIDGLDLNANFLADSCLHVVANAGSATHHPIINNLIVRGYNSRGIILGANSLVISNGQMQLPQMNRVYWQGGAAGAIGFLLNAQNAEFVVGNGWYFDVEPTAYNPHSNHIAAVSGGINVQGLLSTRASSYAIKSYGSQVIVNGWRSEDGYLFQTTAVQLEGPCSIKDAQFRAVPASMTQPSATEPTIDFQGVDSTLILTGISTQCSIRVGATSARNVVATGIDFRDAAAGFLYSGPSNRRGIYHRFDTGNVDICGTDAAVQLKTTAGVTTVALEDGGLRQVPFALPQITANQPSLVAEGYSFFRLTNNGAYDIQGIGTPTNGRRICFVNLSASVLTFKHLSASASPVTWQMRSNTGADITLAQHEMIEMIYDGLSSTWRMWKL